LAPVWLREFGAAVARYGVIAARKVIASVEAAHHGIETMATKITVVLVSV
jgi:hypothetical protein